jgi:hypothetical protein
MIKMVMDMTNSVPCLPIKINEPHRLEHSIASDALSVIDVLQEYIQKGMWVDTMGTSKTMHIEQK